MENGRNKESYRNLLWIGTRAACNNCASWKCALTLHRYISVTDKVKINEKNNSIVTGPLYVHTEFKTIWTLLPEDVAFLNPTGYRISLRRHRVCAWRQNIALHTEMVQYDVLKIGSR